MKKSGKDLLIIFAPLKDYSDTTVGVMAIPMNITLLLSKANSDLKIMLIASFAVLIFLIFIVNFTFNRFINKPLEIIMDNFHTVGKGDLTREIVGNMPSLNCSSLMECGQNDCSCYNKESRCWETAGSFSVQVECPKLITGEYQSCTECTAVYQKVNLDELQVLSSYFNAFVYSQRILIGDMGKAMTRMSSASGEMSDTASTMQEAVSGASKETEKVARAAEKPCMTI